MIDTLSATQALDKASTSSLVLLCFARSEDLVPVVRFLEKYSQTKSIKLVRVEPVVEAAKTLQLARFPTFILYDNGNERFSVVGTDLLVETLERKL